MPSVVWWLERGFHFVNNAIQISLILKSVFGPQRTTQRFIISLFKLMDALSIA